MSFDWLPTLEGEHLFLRAATEADRDSLYAVASDPEIWAMHPAHDRHLRPVFDAFLDLAFADRGGLVVEDRATGRALGFSRYSETRAGAGEIEIGWTFLARDTWGRGVNSEMKRLMIEHAFGSYGHIIFLIGEDNLRSRRAVAKLGATESGRILDAEAAGRKVRHLVYLLSKEDWR